MTRELNELRFSLQPTNNQLLIKNPTSRTFSMTVPPSGNQEWDHANNVLLKKELYLYFFNRGQMGRFFVGGYHFGYEKTLAMQCQLNESLPPVVYEAGDKLEPSTEDEYAFDRVLDLLSIPKGDFDKPLANGLTLAHHFALLGRVDCLRVFLKMGGRIDVAAGSCDVQTEVNDVAIQGIDTNKLPIHYACIAGHANIVELIALFTASSQTKNTLQAISKDDCQPAHYAALFGYDDCIDMLSKYRVNLNAQKFFGYRPIHLAAMQGHAKAVEALIRGGADVNATATDPEPQCIEYPVIGGCGFLGLNTYAVVACRSAANQAMRSKSTAAHFAARSGAWLNVLEILVNSGAGIDRSVLNAIPTLKPPLILRVTDLDPVARAAVWANTHYITGNETQDYRMWIRGCNIISRDPRYQALLARRKDCRDYLRNILSNQGTGGTRVVPNSTSSMTR